MYECTHVCFSKLSRKEGRGNKYASNSVKSYYLDTFAELQGYSSWQQNRALLLLVRLNEAHFCRSVATQEPKQSYPEMKPFVETLDYSLLTQDPNLPEIQKKTHTHLRGIEKRDTRTWFWRGHHGLRILIGAEKIIERKSNFFWNSNYEECSYLSSKKFFSINRAVSASHLGSSAATPRADSIRDSFPLISSRYQQISKQAESKKRRLRA